MAKRVTRLDAAQIINSVDTFFFDCDGVIWDTFGAIAGAKELIAKLRSLGKQVFFVTNNNTEIRSHLLKKFHKLGFNVDEESILSSAYMTALYLKKQNYGKKVYMIGNPGLAKELDAVGVNYIGLGPQPGSDDPTKSIFAKYNLTKDPDVGAVVVAFDEHFNMNKIAQAQQYLKDDSVAFVATNPDHAFPVGRGIFTPGTGVLVNAVATASGRKPTIVGKPNTLMYEITESTYHIDPKRTLMTGDRLDTDILFGKKSGLRTLLVLSGVTNQGQVDKLKESDDPQVMPDFVATDLRDLCCAF